MDLLKSVLTSELVPAAQDQVSLLGKGSQPRGYQSCGQAMTGSIRLAAFPFSIFFYFGRNGARITFKGELMFVEHCTAHLGPGEKAKIKINKQVNKKEYSFAKLRKKVS